MVYFQNLSFILGALMMAGGLWILLFPASYRTVAEKMLPEKIISWVVPVCLAWVVLIAFTWYMYLQYTTPVSLILSLILSLSLIKMYAALFRYSSYREFALSFLNADNMILKVFALVYLALGAALLAIGFAL